VVASSIVAGKAYSYPLAIFLIVPLKILPLLVFGNLDKNNTPSSLQNAPTSVLTFKFMFLAIAAYFSSE